MTYYGDDDPNLPLPTDMDDGGEDDFDLPPMQCPNCRATVTEDTQKCPACGDWITPEDVGQGNFWSKHSWKIIAVLLMLLAMWRFIL